MTGIELSREYFNKFGKPLLEKEFGEFLPYLAAGVCGKGSENFGYDDEISRDHDYEPGFIVFLPGEDVISRRDAFLMEKAYSSLPKEFEGVSRLKVAPVGGSRHGIKRTAEFFKEITGSENGELSLNEWLRIPESLLAEATNGEIFFDYFGEVTRIRSLFADMPEDIRRKKLAGALIIMAQAGQYNYSRCLSHGEEAAAQLCVIEFEKSAMNAVFLLNKKPVPFYKWAFRAMRELPLLGNLADSLEFLISSDNSPENRELKLKVIGDICDLISAEIENQSIARKDCELERLAYAVNDSIKDAGIRGMNVFL